MNKLNAAALLTMLSMTTSLPLQAKPELMSDEANIVGKSRLTYIFWDVYDAVLYAPNGNWSEEKPFALKLSYLRDLEGKAIAERSVEEMRKQGLKNDQQLAKWQSTMAEIFPDVKEGDSLIGEVNNDGHTQFYFNGEPAGTVKDTEFTRAFFDIWLSEKTSEPEMRKQLLGVKK